MKIYTSLLYAKCIYLLNSYERGTWNNERMSDEGVKGNNKRMRRDSKGRWREVKLRKKGRQTMRGGRRWKPILFKRVLDNDLYMMLQGYWLGSTPLNKVLGAPTSFSWVCNTFWNIWNCQWETSLCESTWASLFPWSGMCWQHVLGQATNLCSIVAAWLWLLWLASNLQWAPHTLSGCLRLWSGAWGLSLE